MSTSRKRKFSLETKSLTTCASCENQDVPSAFWPCCRHVTCFFCLAKLFRGDAKEMWSNPQIVLQDQKIGVQCQGASHVSCPACQQYPISLLHNNHMEHVPRVDSMVDSVDLVNSVKALLCPHCSQDVSSLGSAAVSHITTYCPLLSLRCPFSSSCRVYFFAEDSLSDNSELMHQQLILLNHLRECTQVCDGCHDVMVMEKYLAHVADNTWCSRQFQKRLSTSQDLKLADAMRNYYSQLYVDAIASGIFQDPGNVVPDFLRLVDSFLRSPSDVSLSLVFPQ